MVAGRRQAFLAGRCLILALPALLIPGRADALDPAKAVADYSVTSWRETEGLLTAVTAITQDTTGYLWVGGENGLFRFDGARFVRRPLASLRVNALCAARDGSVWVGLTEGNVVRLLQEQATVFSVRDELPLATVTDLLCDRAGTVWAATSKGLTRIVNGRWQRLGHESGVPEERIQSLFEDHLGRLWVGSEAGIFRRRATSDDHFDPQPGPLQVRGFSEDPAGRVFTTDRQRVFAPLGNSVASPGPSIKGLGMTLRHDRDGNLWAATRGQGVVRIRGTNVESLRRQDGLTSDSIQALFEDRDGNLWVGTARGLDMISEGSVSRPYGDRPDDTEFVYSVTADREGGVWFGTIGGLDHYASGRWTRFSERDSLPENLVYATHLADDGRLWLATNNGVGWFNDGRFHQLAPPHGLTLSRVDSIATDGDRGVWFCDLGSGSTAGTTGPGRPSKISSIPRDAAASNPTTRDASGWCRVAHSRFSSMDSSGGSPPTTSSPDRSPLFMKTIAAPCGWARGEA